MKLIKTFFILLGLLSLNIGNAQSSATTSRPAKSTITKSVKSAKSVKTAPVAASTNKPGLSYTFDKEKIVLGKMKKGSKKTFEYIMTNTGTENIEIEIVSGCDCTTLDWTRGIIKPGQKATISAIFDSTEKEITEKSTDVDVYLKNKDKKTGSSIFKILNFTYDLF